MTAIKSFASAAALSLVVAGAATAQQVQEPMLPPNAQPGECYARVYTPPTYETDEVTVLKKEAGQRVEIIPAQYETVEERVLVKAASSRLVEVPATYETVSETIEVAPAQLVWRTGTSGNAKLADGGLVASARGILGTALDSAAPGECFAEYTAPAQFETVTEEVLLTEASARVEIVPAQYEMVEEVVVTQPASTRVEEVPAEYGWEEERILVKAAHTTWKEGRGPIEKLNDSTGEIMCLVEVPAEYKTVRKRVLVSPATTRTIDIPAKTKVVKVRKLVADAREERIDIPAEYQTVTRRVQSSAGGGTWTARGAEPAGYDATGRQICRAEIPAEFRTVSKKVVASPARTDRVDVPAEYDTVSVRKLVTEARTETIEIPAEYQTVAQRRMVTEGRLAWRSILCETNMSAGVVAELQNALNAAGYDAGVADGSYGRRTADAVDQYQRANGLATGQLTMETLRKLGIGIGG